MATPRGVTQAWGIFGIDSICMGIAHWAATSLSNDFDRAALFSSTFADWWFPRRIMCWMSFNLSSSVIGSRWYIAPLDRISSTLDHCGWRWRSGFIVVVGRNSDPYDSDVLCGNCVAFSMSKLAFSSSWLLCCAASFVRLNDQGLGCIGWWCCFFMVAMAAGRLNHIVSVQFVLCTLFGVQCRLRLNDLPSFVSVKVSVFGCCGSADVSFAFILDRVCSSRLYVADFSAARGFGIFFMDLGGRATMLRIGVLACSVCCQHRYD